jgi:hypothetical protein
MMRCRRGGRCIQEGGVRGRRQLQEEEEEEQEEEEEDE